jgi:hypothetical protein
MEYRMKYRDIPWSVALAVPFGKFIGCCIIQPYRRITQVNWKRASIRWGKRLLGIVIVSVILTLLFILVESATEGALSEGMFRIYKHFLTLLAKE